MNDERSDWERMINHTSITIAIMAGGRSRRMGRDKAFVEIDGVPMLERVVIAALGTGLPVMVVGRERPEGWRYDDVRFVIDQVPDRGPLGGLATALEVSGTSVLALACDMPFVTTEALRWLIGAATTGLMGNGMVAVSEGTFQPLFSVYCIRVRRIIDEMLERQACTMTALIVNGKFKEVCVPDWLKGACENINDEATLREKSGGC
jgi:molybdenum cofactor guanylyltransferase